MERVIMDRPWRRFLRYLSSRVDTVLLAALLLLAAYGVLIIYSATKVTNIHAGLNPQYYLERQTLYDVLGVIAMVVTMVIGYRRLVQLGRVVYILLMVSLIGVMAIGHSTLGSQRWFSLGPFQLQPSAFASLALILALAFELQRNRGDRIGARELAKLLVLAIVPILLVVKQPDLGSAMVMLITVTAVLVVAGVPGRYLIGLTLMGVVVIAAALSFHLLHAYQLNRLTSFIHQNSASTYQTTTYNIQQSKYAISSGGIRGKGLFGGAQINGGYVPEFSTDFIFAAVGEQLGFVGSAFLLALYSVIAWRLWRAAAAATDRSAQVVAAGVLALIGFSVFQNAGMTMGIMPVAGIPLPLVSFGGSAIIDTFAAVGLVLSFGIDRSR